MRKYKAVVLTIQVFCLLLLIMSGLLERGVTQVAYCFTAFSLSFLLIAFGEAGLRYEKVDIPAMAVVVFEGCISGLFIGAAITGMKMGGDTLRGFSTLLAVYGLATDLAIIERVVTRVKIQRWRP